MYKIFLTVRNRLAVTAKCVTALKKHSSYSNHIYVYENSTSYKIAEHFMYWSMLYERNLISQVTFTTKDSTFGAFSKASACNFFGLQHEQDPKKDNYKFLVFLDNDIIVTPGWDEIISNAWDDVNRLKMSNIKIIGQLPGGIKPKKDIDIPIGGYPAVSGKIGGSGFWCVRSSFFRDVGYLNLKSLLNCDKKHDSSYWDLLSQASNNQDYIIGLKHKLCIHVGKIAGSTCNVLTRNRNMTELQRENSIKFEGSENKIDEMSFVDFYELVSKDPDMAKDW